MEALREKLVTQQPENKFGPEKKKTSQAGERLMEKRGEANRETRAQRGSGGWGLED